LLRNVKAIKNKAVMGVINVESQVEKKLF